MSSRVQLRRRRLVLSEQLTAALTSRVDVRTKFRDVRTGADPIAPVSFFLDFQS